MSFLKFSVKSSSKKHGKKILWSIVAVLLLLLISSGLWLGWNIYQAGGKIITANSGVGSVLLHKLTQDIKPAELNGESDGRVNILLIGIDQAAGLADVQQVISIDTVNKKAAMLSIPRDLWATIPGHGSSKINSCHSYGESSKKGSGADLCVATVSKLLDLPIQYYVQVNFQGLKQLVDAAGGITVNVDNTFDDYEYPTENYGIMHIHFNAGIQQMDGTVALQYARSRHSINASEGSDFARSRRQQKVLLALRDKMLSAGVLANPLKVNQIINAVGDNLRTNLQTDEIQQLIKMFKDIDTSKIITEVLDTSASSPLTGGQIDERGYIITPKDGDYTYKSLQTVAHEIFTNPFLVKEKSTIEIRNATGKSGLGSTVSAQLKSYGYDIMKVTTNPTKEVFTELVDYSGGKRPFTQSFLEKRFQVKAQESTPSPADSGVDFVLILGSDYGNTTQIKQ